MPYNRVRRSLAVIALCLAVAAASWRLWGVAGAAEEMAGNTATITNGQPVLQAVAGDQVKAAPEHVNLALGGVMTLFLVGSSVLSYRGLGAFMRGDGRALEARTWRDLASGRTWPERLRWLVAGW